MIKKVIVPNLVSIIMPAYNAEKTISDSINSVINQTYNNWELIIVNDGSSDTTDVQIKKFLQLGNIKYISQINQGVSKARNVALNIARGEYIAFLDSDDIWINNKLECQVKYLSEKKHIDLLYSDVYRFFDSIDDAYILQDHRALSHFELKDRLLIYDFIPIVSVIVRSSILKKTGFFDESLSGPEDWDLWIRIAREHNIEKALEITAFYRENPKGISKNMVNQLKNEEAVRKKHLSRNLKFTRVYRKSFWLDNRNKAIYEIKKKQYFSAFKYLMISFFYDPFTLQNFLPNKIMHRKCSLKNIN